MRSLVLAIAIPLLAPALAHADQCEWMTSEEGTRAVELLAKYPNVIRFCELCGDTVPGAPFVAREVTVRHPDPGLAEISINGEVIDLAYTYVQTSPTRYENLAMLAGCEVDSVSPSLAVEGATPDGVLITAVTTPVATPAAPAPEPLAEPLPPQPVLAPAHVTYYYATTIEQPLPWLVIALAAGGGFIAGIGFAATALVVRGRRRAMRPRAADL